MTEAQKRLRELRQKQSKQRQRMAEFSLLDELTDELRSELDTIENGNAGPGAPIARRDNGA